MLAIGICLVLAIVAAAVQLVIAVVGAVAALVVVIALVVGRNVLMARLGWHLPAPGPGDKRAPAVPPGQAAGPVALAA